MLEHGRKRPLPVAGECGICSLDYFSAFAHSPVQHGSLCVRWYSVAAKGPRFFGDSGTTTTSGPATKCLDTFPLADCQWRGSAGFAPCIFLVESRTPPLYVAPSLSSGSACRAPSPSSPHRHVTSTRSWRPSPDNVSRICQQTPSTRGGGVRDSLIASS